MYAARSRTISRRCAASARVASSFCCVVSISASRPASFCVASSTWAVSCFSIAWFWLTWLASAAKAYASGFATGGAGLLELVATGVVVVVVDVVEVVVVDGLVVVDEVVVVDGVVVDGNSWAKA